MGKINKKNKIAFVTAAYLLLKMSEKKKRKWWVRPIFQNRSSHGYYNTYLAMKRDDLEKYFKAVRMAPRDFDALLNLLKERLTKTSIRTPISPECRLVITLMYFAHGGARFIYSQSFKIGESTFRAIVLETAQAIWSELSKLYLSQPNQEEYLSIAKHYEDKWGMPHCLGALDGKHINIIAPNNANSQYYNYKGHHSIVLLAACDANYSFTMVDIGAYWSQSDGGVLKETAFGQRLYNNSLNIPKAARRANGDIMPFYFVADSAFQLHENVMRPYAGKNLTPSEEIFNKKLSRARVTIENSFGIMASRWRILLNTIHASPDTVQSYVMAITVLHNFLMLRRSSYCCENFGDRIVNDELILGEWRKEICQMRRIPTSASHNATRVAYNVRNRIKDMIQ